MKKEKYLHTFQKDLDYFLTHIESLYFSLPLLTEVISETQKNSAEALSKYVAKLPTKKIEENGVEKSVFVIQPKNYKNFHLLRDRTIKANISLNLIPRSFLISLISHYDAFIGSLIKNLFSVTPEKLNSSEKQFTYSELLLFNNINDAKDALITQEAETVLRESHSKQINWLEKKFDVKLTSDLPSWPKFIEATERRNLFVHNDGIITSQYIKVCKTHKFIFSKSPIVGEKLDVSNIYFEEIFSILYELGVKLTQVFWSKYFPNEGTEAAKSFTDLIFNLISKKKYDLSINLLEFATKYLINFSDNDKKICKINLAQCYKWTNRENDCEKILDAEDWTACESTFKLCVAVLKDGFNDASEIMKELGDKEILDIAYQEWPVFKEFRKEEVFLNTYKEIYKNDFNILDKEDESTYDIKIEDSKKQA